MPKVKNRIGEQYGHWKVIDQDLSQTDRVYWICECDCGCGTQKSIRSDSLKYITIGGCKNILSSNKKICLKCQKEFFTKKLAGQRQYCYNCLPQENYNGAEVRKQIKEWALEYKGKQCIICGYSKCVQALDFHHLHDKDFNLSDRNLKLDWIEIKKELDKCIVVCANCHREIHANYKILSEEDYEF